MHVAAQTWLKRTRPLGSTPSSCLGVGFGGRGKGDRPQAWVVLTRVCMYHKAGRHVLVFRKFFCPLIVVSYVVIIMSGCL